MGSSSYSKCLWILATSVSMVLPGGTSGSRWNLGILPRYVQYTLAQTFELLAGWSQWISNLVDSTKNYKHWQGTQVSNLPWVGGVYA